ncbi:TPA: hypothetical protein VJ674_001132 [Streptococcus pyogenes]|nr:hypothetical protein C5P47_08710 [Streptococcus pyogenes]QCK27799.1 hypothetical protein ETT72_09235 [Streptococcus pyogenes]HEP1299583.1 hypothetical protein [Streptococcus pyogenes]HEP1860030.1 hypothetical protein [Streptococcus pyogenes]HEP1889783.1 hypothetical protein [Streptococcus pyogenes]
MGGYLPTRSVGRASRRHCTFFLTLANGIREDYFLKVFSKLCNVCGGGFESSSNVSKYCSDKCRRQSIRTRQNHYMKQKRKLNNSKKRTEQLPFANTNLKKRHDIEYIDPYKKKMDRALKKKDWETYYRLYQQQILDNEKEWGFTGIHIVNGIEVHDEDFVESVLKTLE